VTMHQNKFKSLIKSILLSALTLSVFNTIGCSYTTDFVLVNNSGEPIAIRYIVKESKLFPEDFDRPPVAPSVSPIKNLSDQTRWKVLSGTEYKFDSPSRTVSMQLMPGYGLRIDKRNLQDAGQDEASKSRNFGIETIEMTGTKGEILLTGEQARIAFTFESKSLATITYR
jgi:hypothetical protein